MDKKVIGCILLILGTSIGAGMLALPVVTAGESFSMSLLLLFSGWSLMTIGAYSLLEVACWLPANANMISMAGRTIGAWGQGITWFIYLLLLYSLLCAYLSGLSDIIQSLLANLSLSLPRWAASVIGLLLLATIVYRGIASVDVMNRALMGAKLMAYFLLILLVAKHINLSLAMEGGHYWNHSAFMVMLTSFGYAIIIPSIRSYLQNNITLLRNVIFIGSLIPLILYAIWIFAVQGLIVKQGQAGLLTMLTSDNTNSMLMHGIAAATHSNWVALIVNFFVSICAVTSFLGVSLCLVDFIADGLSVEKKGRPALLVYGLTYLPPLVIVLLFPGVFIKALDYGGILCLVLLIIIPLLMLYVGRYHRQLRGVTFLPCSKKFLLGLLVIAFLILSANVYLA